MIEKWKDISGYEGYYQVSTFGRIRAMGHKYQRKGVYILALHENNGYGYLLADLHKDNKYKSVAVHRLVAETFIPNPEKLSEVNHIDGNKQNNNVDNLEWVSRSQNCWHRCNILGKRTKRIKDITNGLIFPSQKSAALYYGVSEHLIESLVKKRIKSNRKRKQPVSYHTFVIITEKEYVDFINTNKTNITKGGNNEK